MILSRGRPSRPSRSSGDQVIERLDATAPGLRSRASTRVVVLLDAGYGNNSALRSDITAWT